MGICSVFEVRHSSNLYLVHVTCREFHLNSSPLLTGSLDKTADPSYQQDATYPRRADDYSIRALSADTVSGPVNSQGLFPYENIPKIGHL